MDGELIMRGEWEENERPVSLLGFAHITD